jgi:hypothetical protein
MKERKKVHLMPITTMADKLEIRKFTKTSCGTPTIVVTAPETEVGCFYLCIVNQVLRSFGLYHGWITAWTKL